MAYSSSIQVVNDANGTAYAFLADNGQVWQCQWNPQAGQWEQARVVPGASGGVKLDALFHPDLWPQGASSPLPGIVLAYRVGSGDAAEVYSSLGQWNSQGELSWSAPLPLTNDQADDQAFSIVSGGTGAFSLVSQKQTAAGSLATHGAQGVAPTDSDLYQTDLQVSTDSTTLNNISNGAATAVGSISFTAEAPPTAAAPGSTSGNTQLTREALITPPAPPVQPMAALALMSAAADPSSAVLWQPNNAFQPSAQPQTFSWGWKQLGQNLLKWQLQFGQKDAVKKVESDHDDADPSEPGREALLKQRHSTLTGTISKPGSGDHHDADVFDGDDLKREEAALGLTFDVVEEGGEHNGLQLTLQGSFGLRASGNSGSTVDSSATWGLAKDDGGGAKGLLEKSYKKDWSRGKIPGWRGASSRHSFGGGGEVNTEYNYNFKNSGANLLSITTTDSLGFDYTHKKLSVSDEGSSFVFNADVSIGGLYRLNLNSKSGSSLPEWLALLGLTGAAAADLEMVATGIGNEALLMRYWQDKDYRARLGIGVREGQEHGLTDFTNDTPTGKSQLFNRLNYVNMAVGSLLAAGGPISAGLMIGGALGSATLQSGAALEESVALSARYLFRSIVGVDLSVTDTNFTSWSHDGSDIVGLDQDTISISAGVALPMGVTIGLLDYSHSWSWNLDYGQQQSDAQPADIEPLAAAAPMVANAAPMLASADAASSTNGRYYNADQQATYPLRYTPQSGSITLVSPADSSGAYASTPLLGSESSLTALQLFQLGTTTAGDGSVNVSPPSNPQSTASNLKDGSYTVAILGNTLPGQQASSGATATFEVVNGSIDPSTFAISSPGSYLSLPETAPGSNEYALILDLFSTGIAPAPSADSFQSPWANLPLITVSGASTESGTGSPLMITPVQQVSTVVLPPETSQPAPELGNSRWSQTQSQTSQNTPVLATDGTMAYMAATLNGLIWWTSSNDGGQTWADWQNVSVNINTWETPALAVVNGTLYLSYIDGDYDNTLRITYLEDALRNEWADGYLIPGQPASQVCLISETQEGSEQLALYYVTDDGSNRILKAYSSAPQTSSHAPVSTISGYLQSDFTATPIASGPPTSPVILGGKMTAIASTEYGNFDVLNGGQEIQQILQLSSNSWLLLTNYQGVTRAVEVEAELDPTGNEINVKAVQAGAWDAKSLWADSVNKHYWTNQIYAEKPLAVSQGESGFGIVNLAMSLSSWSTDIAITDSEASSPLTSSGTLAITQHNGQTYLAYQGGSESSPENSIFVATSATANNGSSWSATAVANPGQQTGVGLTSDSNGLLLSYVNEADPGTLRLSRITPQANAVLAINATTTQSLPSSLSNQIAILNSSRTADSNIILAGINTAAGGYNVENAIFSQGTYYPEYDASTETASQPGSASSNQVYTYENVPVQLFTGSPAANSMPVPLLNPGASAGSLPDSVLATVVLSGGAIQSVELNEPLLLAQSSSATPYTLLLHLPAAVTLGLEPTVATPTYAVTPQNIGYMNLVADDQFSAQANGGKAGVYVAAGMSDGLPLDPSMAAWPIQSRVAYVSEEGSGVSTVVYLNGIQSYGSNETTAVGALSPTDLSLQNIYNNNVQFTLASHPTAIQLAGKGAFAGDTFVAWVEAGNPVIPVADATDGTASFQNLMQQLYGNQRINFRIYDSQSNSWQAPSLEDLYTAGQAEAGGSTRPAVINHLQAFNVPDGSAGFRTMLVWSETSIQAIKGSVEAGFSTAGDNTTIPTVIKAGWLNTQPSSLSWEALLSDANGNSTVQTIPWDSQSSVGLSITDLSIASALLLQSDGALAQSPLITWSQAVRSPYTQSVLDDRPALYLQFSELQSGLSDINIGTVDSAYTSTSASATGLNFTIAGALPAYQGAAVQNIDGTGVLNTGLGTAFSSLQQIINNIPDEVFTGANQAIAEFTGSFTPSGTDTSSATLTVTAISAGTLSVGDVLSGAGIAAGTTITAKGTVDADGLGTYVVNQPQSLTTTITMQAIPAPTELPLIGVEGSISGTTLSVSSVGAGGLQVGDLILGEGVAPGTIITAVGTVDASGVGSYSVNNSQTVASSALVATPNIPTAPYTLEFWAQLPAASNPNGAGLVALGQPSAQAVGAAVAPSGWQLNASFQVAQITYQQALEGGLISSSDLGSNLPTDLYGWGWSVRATGANTSDSENGGGSNLYNNALLIRNLYSGVKLSGVDAFLSNYNLRPADLPGIGGALANTVAVVPTTEFEFNNALEGGNPTSSLNGINILTNTAVMNQGLVSATDIPAAQQAMFEALWNYQQLTGQAKVNFTLPSGSGGATTTPNAQNGETYAAYPLDFKLTPGVAVSVNGSGQLVFDVSDSVSIPADSTSQIDWRDGNWHYIVASYLPDYQTYTAADGTQVQLPTHRGTAQLYVDNQLVGSASNITGAYLPINSNDSALLLANNNGGALDQLAVYDKALTGITPSSPSGNWPQPSAADALKLLRELGYSLDTQTPNPGAMVGAVNKHWAVRGVNPNDAVQNTFSSSYDASSGSWTTARPLNPSLAVDPTTPSYSTRGPVQDPLIMDLTYGNQATDSPWNPQGSMAIANQTLQTITYTITSGGTTSTEYNLSPSQILVGNQSLAEILPQATDTDLNYVIPSNNPDFTVLIPRGDLPKGFAEDPKSAINIKIATAGDSDSSTTDTWNYTSADLGTTSNLLTSLATEINTDNIAIATAPLVTQAPLQLKYIDSGISLSSASDAQAANSPAAASPANSFGQSQVIGSLIVSSSVSGTTTTTVKEGWIAIAQPFSTNATSNPAGRVWIQYTGQSTSTTSGNSSSTTPSTTPAQAPSTWLNALADSNFSPDSPNLPLLNASSSSSSVGGLLIQADPSDGWGQNFGETMLVADLDGDHNQDLIIAAPQANGGGRVVIIAGKWIADNLTTAGATTTLNLSNQSGLGSAFTVLTPIAPPSTSTDDISVAGFGSALAVDTSTTNPTLWIGAPNYLRQLDGSNATPLESLQPIGAVYSWQSGQAPSLPTAAVGTGGTVTSAGTGSGTSTTYWGSQLGAAIAADGNGKIAISAPGVMASLLYSGTDVAQQNAAGKTKPKAPFGDGALVKIQLPSAANPHVSTTLGTGNPDLQPVATADSQLANTVMQNLKQLQVNNIAQATQENNQAIQSAPVGAVYLFNSSTDISSLSQIDAQSTAATSHQGATFYGPNPWNTLGATGFGSSLSFGDFINTNSDSVLAIGAPLAGGSGAAYLVDASQSFSNPASTSWLAELNLGSNQYLAHLASGLTLYGAENADNFGNGLLNLGDTNQDGYHELLIQAFNASNGAGNGYVLFGSDQLIQYQSTSSLPNPATGSVAMGLVGQFKRAVGTSFNASILTELGGGLSGYTGQGSFGAGDANGDGLNDIPLGSGTNGKAYLTWGHPYLESITSLQLNRLTSDTGYLLDGLATTTPNSLQSIGDFNGDGYDDYLSILPSGNAANGFTSVRIELGAGTQEILADYNSNFYSFLVNTGTELWAAGDVNGDGYSDIALAPGSQQTWGAGISSGILFGRSSSDLPIASSFGLVAPVDGNNAPQSALPATTPGGSTDAAPAVVAVGHTLYSVVKAIGGTDLYYNQSLDGGLSWGNWINLTTTNTGFSTTEAPTLTWCNNKLVLGFLNSTNEIMLASWDPASWNPAGATGPKWSSAATVVPGSSTSGALTSNHSPLLLASDNTLQLLWVDPTTGQLSASSNTSADPAAADPTNSWTDPVILQVSTPSSSGAAGLTPITTTAAPTAAWLGSTPVLATQGIPSTVQQTINGYVPSESQSYAPANANITQASLTVLGGTWEAPGYTGPSQVQRVIKTDGNNWLLAVNDGDDTGVIQIEAYFDLSTGQVVVQAEQAGYWASDSLEADSVITEKWSQPNVVTSVPITSGSGNAGFGIFDLQVSLLPSNQVINVYAGAASETIFSLASQFAGASSSSNPSAPALTTTPTGLALTYLNADGSVSLNRLDVLAANGMPLDGVQVNSNGVLNTTKANLQWQSTLLNASNGNLPKQLASVPVSVDEALLLMNINASGTSTANQVWINAVPPGNNPDSILWQPSALSRATNFGDLNGDGRVDQFSSAGNNAIFTIAGLNYAVWDIRPAGDVNGNGHDDVLLALEPTGPAYVQTTPGQPSALQTVLLDGTLFHVDASSSFSLAQAGRSTSGDWSTAGLKAPLNPWNQAELYDLASTTSADYTPLLQNWITPILNFEAGELTAASVDNDSVVNVDGAKSQSQPSAAVSPDGTTYLLYTGDTDSSNAGLWLSYKAPNSSSWTQVSTQLPVGANALAITPSAAFYDGKLYVAYMDVEYNIYIASCTDLSSSTSISTASNWSSFQLVPGTASNIELEGSASSFGPTLLPEAGRLALYYVPAIASGSTSSIYSLYSTDPSSSSSWGGTYDKSSDTFSGSSNVLQGVTSETGQPSPLQTTSQVAATIFQGRTVLAFVDGGQGGTGDAAYPIYLATQISDPADPLAANSSASWILEKTTATNSVGVGLTTDQALLYIAGNSTNGGSTDSLIWSARPGEAIGQWQTGNQLTVTGLNYGSKDTWTPYFAGDTLTAAWTNNDSNIYTAPISPTIASPIQQSLAGYSIDGNLDTNGDGFADLLISDPSDPSKGVDNQYVLFGGDYLELGSRVGTPGDDVVQGTALADVIYSLAGSDLVVSGGGADVILTGAGDDQISITGNAFHRIDGGAGFDELLLQGNANQAYDFQLATSQPQYFFGTKLKNIELISSLDYGANTLSFDAAAVNASNPDRILFVTPDSSDSIVLSAEFQRDSSFDTSFQGSLWSAFAAPEVGAPTAANPALVYVLNPGGAAADSWLSTNVTITGAATPMLMAMRAFAVEEAPLPMALAADAATTTNPATPTTADVVSSTRFGGGLIIDALRSNPQAGVARFRIRRSDNRQDQLLAYSSTSANGSTEPGRDYSPVFGLLRLEAGVSSALITVPLLPQAIASHRDPSVSLRVEEIQDDGQREAHLILHPEADASGVRPVLSGLELAMDALGRTARLSLRADTLSEELNHLRLGVSRRSSADTQTLTETRRLALADVDPSGPSQLPQDGTAPLPVDHDGRANQQVSARFVLNLDPAGSAPLVALHGPDPHGSDAVALVGSNQVRFRADSPLTAWRADAGAGTVTFALTAGTRSLPLIQNAEGGSLGSLSPANALLADPISGWLATESKPIGSHAIISGAALADLAWTPTAQRDGMRLPLEHVRVDANQVTAQFGDGVSLVLWQATGTTPTPVAAPAIVDVQRLAGFDNSLGFYPVDSITGSVDGLQPGDTGYLQKALARAEAAGLLLEAQQLPGYGQSASFSHLPLDSRQTYGMLLLQQGDRNTIFSSFADANPDAAPQMIRLGSDAGMMVIGMEDISASSATSDRDFNDIIVNIRNATVPIF